MAKKTVNIGSSANDRTGDSLRAAFDKINDNFDELYKGVITQSVPATSAGVAGDVTGMMAVDNDYIYICVADFDSSTQIWKRIPWSDDTW